MAVPAYKSFLLPIMKVLSDQASHHSPDVMEKVAAALSLTDEEKSELVVCGRQFIYRNRAIVARTNLLKRGLIVQEGKKTYRITEKGLTYLNRSVPAR